MRCVCWETVITLAHRRLRDRASRGVRLTPPPRNSDVHPLSNSWSLQQVRDLKLKLRELTRTARFAAARGHRQVSAPRWRASSATRGHRISTVPGGSFTQRSESWTKRRYRHPSRGYLRKKVWVSSPRRPETSRIATRERLPSSFTQPPFVRGRPYGSLSVATGFGKRCTGDRTQSRKRCRRAPRSAPAGRSLSRSRSSLRPRVGACCQRPFRR
jgi:hypothetical protein